MTIFSVLASKLIILKISPIALLTPPSTKGDGYLISAIWQKSLKISQYAHVQNFMALASKLRISLGLCVIWNINPLALKPPIAPRGLVSEFWLFGKKSYN